MLKELLVTQAVLYGIAYAFLAYLGVTNLGVYVTVTALIYITTVLVYSPLPRRLRIINNIITAALIIAFIYFTTIKIISILA
ncbi:hypothetical protein [Caldivirga maquilingensis]|uniref:Uncharacterized protein n=1 Tax=Caldivirga maquilingensis (strain ATCC 700844 / DSM 13496 / JCM 10307 / IC-167) TaxID=397948 RepID=A8M931_CALMQ|nr:hypothetical protein [Caldivirga maquilingensis]ABW02250.1 hypothetical protein Cmaq_1425 [Caldivirga maquilingensis IC-167]